MEQLTLSFKNIIRQRCEAQGQLSLAELLETAAKQEFVQLDTTLPKEHLQLHWQEFKQARLQERAFSELRSAQLQSYPFQYLGYFQLGEEAEVLPFGEEQFSASLQARPLFVQSDEQAKACNMSWLLELLTQAEKVAADPLRQDELFWEEGPKGSQQLRIERENGTQKEVQIIRFNNNYSTVSWQHQIELG
ncbi:hypothetical protein SapgrDRAFT_1031 [Saprospira grandis DSM 2844]|uniref:Uncharacterized protein n=1 Tax=Saprospira grandis DSM 2844 TaxID=694433 RepID=J0XUX0_9BACT|nr:hypothetical protein [Saprospira grandis]EJF52756.1 hypothetical protein SapgrDRAFT_1031 [Saprospira grandis DSM 2844]